MNNHKLLAALLCNSCKRFTVHDRPENRLITNDHSIQRNELFISQQDIFCCRKCRNEQPFPMSQRSFQSTDMVPRIPENSGSDTYNHYNSAMAIFATDSKGAAGMIRMSMEACIRQNYRTNGEDIGDFINSQFQLRIISYSMKEAMHFVRKSGNKASHCGIVKPGDIQYYLSDEVFLLFGLLNQIVQTLNSMKFDSRYSVDHEVYYSCVLLGNYI